MSSILELINISKNYGSLKTVDNVSISLKSGEFGCVIGPNGCGKSTLLKIAAGILKQSSGEVILKGSISYLPQRLSLLPWKTVEQNIMLPLQIQNSQQQSQQLQVRKLLKKFRLDKFTDQYPEQLSGGMQQKLALLRSIITVPDILLLDEPFSSLDAITRKQMQVWLSDLLHEHKPTVLMVTHDIREALLLGDKIFVLSDRPAKIKKALTVDIPKPRNLQKLSSPAVQQLEKLLEDLLI